MDDLNSFVVGIIRCIGAIPADAWTAIATVSLVGATFLLAWIAYVQIRTTRRQLRAYVGVATARLEPEPSPEVTPLRCTIVLENTGMTPAYNLSTYLNWWWDEDCPDDLPDDFGFGDMGEEGPKSIAMLGAGRQLPSTFYIEGELINRFRRNEIALFYYGHVDYTDVFGKRRHTKFCYAFRHLREGTIGVVLYKTHNDGD